MTDTTPETTSPVCPAERNDTLDVLRGFAMLGILLVNMEIFRGAWYLRQAGDQRWPTTVDRIIDAATRWLAEGKFISGLAFLFGVGAAMQFARGAGRGRLARRYLVLLAIGAWHAVLIWHGDILLLYAVLGLLLLPFAYVRAVTALCWSLAAVAAGAVLGTFAKATPGRSAESYRSLQEQAEIAYNHGGPLDQLVQRLIDMDVVSTAMPYVPFQAFGMFLVGLAAAKSSQVSAAWNGAASPRWLRTFALLGLAVGLPATAVATFGGELLAPFTPSVMVLSAPLLGLTYLALLAMLARRLRSRSWLGPLAAVGRVALTAYLLQSVLCTAVINGLGLYGNVSPLAGLGFVLLIWLVELALCTWWLRHFRLGPVEWLWRSLIYGQRQPFRNASSMSG